jgi:DnaJ-class molecular chaperone
MITNVCKECSGTGMIILGEPEDLYFSSSSCPECNGYGKLETEHVNSTELIETVLCPRCLGLGRLEPGTLQVCDLCLGKGVVIKKSNIVYEPKEG